MTLDFSRHIFEKYANVKFHENSASGSRVRCRWTDGQTETDTTKLTADFRNFVKVPKNM
jgi:hypothetical protein